MRLSGIARRTRDTAHPPEADALLERILVTTATGPLGKIEHLEPFDLEQPDGQLVRVQLAQQLRVEPVDTREAKWGEVEGEPRLASLRANAPGPHVDVSIRQSRVEDGARVELLVQDDDVEHVFTQAGGHRDAPKRQLATVTARLVAFGPEAAAVVDRMLAADAPKPAAKPEEKPRAASRLVSNATRTPLVLVLLSIPFAFAGVALELTPFSVDLGILAVLFAVAGATSWALARIPRFISDGRVVGKMDDSAPGRIVVMTLVFPLTIIGLILFADQSSLWAETPTAAASVYNVSWISALLLAAWSLVVAYFAFIGGRSEARLFRVLLGAPKLPADGALAHTWGSFEGTVRDPTPVTAEGEAVAIVHVVSETVVSGSDPNIFTERVLSKGTFFVDAPDGTGRRIEINPDGAIWASSVALSIPKEDKKSGKTTIEHIRAVPLRGNVLVAGRVDRKAGSPVGHVASGGHESLLFVAVREGQSARAECHAMLVLRRIAFLVALVGVAAAVGTVLFIEPQLPRFNMPEGGD